MKIIILTPNREGVFTDELEKTLSHAGEVIFKTKIQQLFDITELNSTDEKIIALDPDFVNWKFTEDDIKSINNLKAICLQTTSFGWIDTAFASSKGIPVTNLRGFSTQAVAEFSLMMTFLIARKIPIVMHDNFQQDFVKHQGVELRGKKVGIIGLGSIGSRYAEICEAVGMEVLYWSRNARDERFQFLELNELMKTSDVIYPSLAENDNTKKIITDELLSKMRSSALFVSIALKLYNHNAVLEMVNSGKLLGYAFEEENGNPANYKGNILALPSIAWATGGSMKKNGQLWTESIIKAAKNNFPTKIN